MGGPVPVGGVGPITTEVLADGNHRKPILHVDKAGGGTGRDASGPDGSDGTTPVGRLGPVTTKMLVGIDQW